MARKRESYWDKRLERWGAWRVGVRGQQRSQLARLGEVRTLNEDNVPKLYLEERETDAMIKLLPINSRRLLAAAYPQGGALHRKLLKSWAQIRFALTVVHAALGRMLQQRRRGEPLDPERRRKRMRIKLRKIDGRTAAAWTHE
jgi:hypothetical protein